MKIQKTLRIDDNEELHYLDSDDGSGGNKPVIVFVHSNSQSSKSFLNQFEDDSLTSIYRLLAIDLPGHGESAPANDPENTYSLKGYGEVLKSFTGGLGLTNALYVGFSLGGHIVIEAIDKLSAMGLMIFGTPPISTLADFAGALNLTEEESAFTFKGKFNDDDIDFISKVQFSRQFAPIPAHIKKAMQDDLRATDPSTRTCIGQSLAEGKHLDELAIIENLKIPIAVLHGEEDAIIKGSYFDRPGQKSAQKPGQKPTMISSWPTLWHHKVHIIKGAGHAAQIEKPEEFNRLLKEFAGTVFS